MPVLRMELYALTLPPEAIAQARPIEQKIRSDRVYALAVANYLDDLGGGATGDPREDALAVATQMALRQQRVRELVDTYVELAGIAVITGLGVAGIFDPTGIADGAAAGVSLAMTKYGWSYAVDAGLSVVSMIPFADILTKPVMAARLVDRANDLRKIIERAKVAREAVKAFTKVARSGSKLLDDILDEVRKLPDSPYRKMATLKEYMRKRGVTVFDGDQGAKALDKMGHPDALGLFVVLSPKTPGAKPVQAFVFRNTPNSSVVHHEMWHRQDFLKNHGGDFERWGTGPSIDKERYVHERLVNSRRWPEYGAKERANQVLYMKDLEQRAALQKAMDTLSELGIKL